MSNLHAYAVERDGNVSTDFDARTQVIIEKMSQVAYVLSCHQQAVDRHTQQLAELESSLKRLRARR